MVTLKTNNRLDLKRPDIASQFHPTLNGDITPDKIMFGSNKRYYWQCDKYKEHIWNVKVCSRTSLNVAGCPYCSNQRLWSGNCLAVLYPEIASQLHPTLNGDVTPYQIVAYSNKRYYWKCNKGHEWKTSVQHRTINKSNCPACRESKGEKRIAEVLTKMNKIFKQEIRYNSCRSIKPLPFDFRICEKNKIFLIEYQGKQNYEPFSFGGGTNPDKNLEIVRKNDLIKYKWAKKYNIPLLVISYHDFGLIENIIKDFLEENG